MSMKYIGDELGISLRKAQESDMGFLLKLRDLTMKNYLLAAGAPVDEEAYLSRILYRFEDAEIIEMDGKGIGLFKVSYSLEMKQWLLVQIQIHPEYQNCKIGSFLIGMLIDKAWEERGSVFLSVLKSNPAQHLYQRLGFKRIEEYETGYDMIWTA